MKPYTFEEDLYENPFKSTNADSMSYLQIVESWSEPFFMRRKIVSDDFYLRTPLSLIISGARGTGKTMMFKYFSFQAQAIMAGKNNESVLDYFKKNKSVSMYLKFDPYMLQAFSDDEMGRLVFTHFFELVVCEAYVEFVDILKQMKEINEKQYAEIEKGLYDLLGMKKVPKGMEKSIEKLINEVYDYINEKKITGGEFSAKKIYYFKTLSYKVKEILCDVIPQLQGIIFLLVIDEGENFLEFEQRTLNGFVKTLNSRMNRDIFLRIGTREPRIKTYETINKEEFLTIGRDYEQKDINYYTVDSDNRVDYKKWLIQIAKKRLENCQYFCQNDLTNIQNFLGEKENQCEEARGWAANKKNHFKWCLKTKYSDELYEELKVEDNPLLEIMNIWLYKRNYSVDEIKIGLNGYLNGYSQEEERRKIEKYYKDTFAANKVSFLYLLSSLYKKEKKYYSFATYSYLSVGNICNFIKLCREAFDNAYFENKRDLFKGHISAKAQHVAAMSVAYDEIEKVKYIPKYGNELYALVINLGNLFNEYHSDIDLKILEPNQFSVIYQKSYIENVLNTALTWGVFLKKNELQTLDASGNKGAIYTLNKMYCPLFGISYRSKGRYKEIISEDTFTLLTSIQQKKISAVLSTVREVSEQQVPGQMSIFEGEET